MRYSQSLESVGLIHIFQREEDTAIEKVRDDTGGIMNKVTALAMVTDHIVCPNTIDPSALRAWSISLLWILQSSLD